MWGYGVPKVVSLTSALALYVYTNDHAPPHFHVVTPDHDALVDLATLQVTRGTVKRAHWAQVLAWVAQPANYAVVEAEWERCNGD